MSSRRLLWWVVVGALIVVNGCVRHDLDPTLKPYLFAPGAETLFTREVPDAHRVCVMTVRYLGDPPQDCLTLGELRNILAGRAKGL